MTYAARSPAAFGAFTGQSAGDAARPGLLHRLYDSFVSARQKQADRQVERYFEQSGRVLTDATERDMMQRIIANNWIRRG
jgi:hypothetical protein